ncbi:COPI associated protein-domain-containing protein [Sporodiniella umbellata]|nr:COPI associated protein-domain-containing protein [Sporodiniella umbellata]
MASFDVYKGLNCLAIIGLVLSFISDFFFPIWSFILNGIFKIFLLGVLIALEVSQRPAFVKYWSFMYTFLGRAIFYILLAFIIIQPMILSLVGSIIILLIGIVYLALSFTSVEEPDHMSYATYQSIVVRGNTPVIGSQQTHMHQQSVNPSLPTHGQYQFASQTPLSGYQANTVTNQASSPEPHAVQPAPLESVVINNESREKVEVS